MRGRLGRRQGRYAWLTGLFFFVSVAGHWVFGWFAFVDEQQALHQAPSFTPYLVEMETPSKTGSRGSAADLAGRGSSLLSLCGLAVPKENDDRTEAKLDALIRLQAGEKAEEIIAEIACRYLRAGGHSKHMPMPMTPAWSPAKSEGRRQTPIEATLRRHHLMAPGSDRLSAFSYADLSGRPLLSPARQGLPLGPDEPQIWGRASQRLRAALN